LVKKKFTPTFENVCQIIILTTKQTLLLSDHVMLLLLLTIDQLSNLCKQYSDTAT